MDNIRLKLLLLKYINDRMSEKERREFFALIAEPAHMKLLRKYAAELDLSNRAIIDLPSEIAGGMLADILSTEKEATDPENLFHLNKGARKATSSGRRKRLFYRLSGLVGVLLLGLGFYFFVGHKKQRNLGLTITNQVIKDAMPGHSGAILTLSNGKTYLLDTTSNGLLRPGIKKSDKSISVSDKEEVFYATLETPYGRDQQLLLSDGTRVWLNAGSSIHFPSVFNGPERRVEITGEAYFEVVHNEQQPFVVVAGNDVIQDLGTHFDVNAYCDEPTVKTTLLEGSVRIGNVTLVPGWQYANGRIKKVDAQATIAWISGFFHFEDADIKSVMQQLGRWYNVQVHYEGNLSSQKFEGEIQRSLKLSQVLNLIAGIGIHYRLDGNQLTVSP